MKVKAIASFFHGGSRKVGDEFEVSDRAGGLLEAKGLVELSAPLVISSATDGLDGDSPKVAGSDTEGDSTPGALDQGQVVADAVAATNEGGQPVRSPAADDPVGDSHQVGGLDAGLGNVSGTLEQNPDVVNADAATKEDETVVEPAQAELAPVSANSSKAGGSKTKHSA
ncbi:hypothetical protein JT27_15745 [Alcaligenes faecalis]|uniref:hypothetical protein n=1 Tax=Alcaligenes faecalis TaxID=511 RepID=UPI00052CBB61|nr:hypothetical protein [Alcaligenes faecalis]KGP00566.1 hypothetical protein JT27_15745 [Alcaligenes faecalis]